MEINNVLVQTFKKFEQTIFLVASALLGLAPLSWFHGKLIAGEEFYSLDYAKWIGIFGKAWAPYLNYGESTILVPLKIQGILFFFLDHIGITTYTSQIVWYVFLWVTTSVACYLFLQKLFEKTVPPAILFVATIFYVYNPFFLNISPFLTPPRLVFIALPIILNILYSVFKQGGKLPKEMFQFALVLFFASPVFVNLPAGFAILMLIGLGLAYKYLLLDKDYKSFLISAAYLGTFSLVVSAWWLIPVAKGTLSSTDSIKTVAAAFTAVSSSRINDVLSQFGSWAFREKIYGYDYYYFTYNKAFDSLPLVLLRYIPYMLAIAGAFLLLESAKTKKELSSREEFSIFLVFMFGLFIFLSKGSSGVLGGVFEFMYRHLPFFWVFREPYAKFMPVVSAVSTPLIVYGYLYLSKLLSSVKNSSAGLIISLGICFISIGYPIWRGDVLWTVNDRDVRSYEIVMPKFWQSFINEWKPQNGYYLLFPSNGMTDRFMWPSGYIGNPYLLFTNARTINPVSSYVLNKGVQRVVRYMYNKVFSDPTWLNAHVERYNVSGLIFQADTSYYTYIQKRDFIKEKYKNYLASVYDKIDLYEFGQKDKPTTDFSIIPANKLLWTKSTNIDNYAFLRSVVPDDTYFVFSDDSSIFNSYIVEEDKDKWAADSLSETVVLKDINKADYSAYVDDKYNFINDISVDTTTVASTVTKGIRSFEVKYSDVCCSFINFKVKSPVEVSIEKDWTVLQKVDDQHMGQAVYTGTKLDLSTTAKSYYKKLNNYDPYMDHLVFLQGQYVGNTGFNLFTVQRDTDIFQENPLIGGTIPQLNGQQGVTFYKADILDTSFNSEYYIVVRKPEPLGGGQAHDAASGDSLDLTGMKLFTIYHPSTFLVKKDAIQNVSAGAILPAEQRKIDDTLVLTKVPENATGGYLQFKNSFNRDWRLVEMTDADWQTASNGSALSKLMLSVKVGIKSFSSKEPVNVEYYSNAWELNSSARVYAVVFLQEMRIRGLFIVAVAGIIAGLLRKRW